MDASPGDEEQQLRSRTSNSRGEKGRRLLRNAAPAIFALLLVLTLSAFTPSAMRGVRCPALVRSSWRFQGATCALLPLALLEARCTTYGTAWLAKAHGQRMRVLLALVATGFTFVLGFSLFSVSLALTSLPHSTLFSNISPLPLACISVLRCERVRPAEWCGIVLTIAGIAVALRDVAPPDSGSDSRVPSDHTRRAAPAGDLVAFGGSCVFAVFILTSRWLRSEVGMPQLTFLAGWTACGCAFSLAFMWAAAGTSEGASDECPAPFWRTEYPVRVAYLALMMGGAAQGGLAYALKHLPALLVSLVMTLNPIFMSAAGYMLGEGAAPGPWSATGGCVTLLGIGVTLVAQTRRQTKAAPATPEAAASLPLGKPAVDSPAEPSATSAARVLAWLSRMPDSHRRLRDHA